MSHDVFLACFIRHISVTSNPIQTIDDELKSNQITMRKFQFPRMHSPYDDLCIRSMS